MGPLLAMRRALYSALVNDAALAGLLGGAKIYASVPPATDPPYVTFGQTRVTLWNGGSHTGHKHQCVFDIWSLQWGDAEMLAVADRIAQVIAGSPPAPDGLHVLQCYVEGLVCHLPRADGWRQASLEIAALTEQST